MHVLHFGVIVHALHFGVIVHALHFGVIVYALHFGVIVYAHIGGNSKAVKSPIGDPGTFRGKPI